MGAWCYEYIANSTLQDLRYLAAFPGVDPSGGLSYDQHQLSKFQCRYFLLCGVIH
jgi:hypothetical protein